MNAVYREFSPRVEIYSIDESFLDISDVRTADRVPLRRDLRATVRAWTGIPTCVGIGPTKTLTKLANHIAKKHARARTASATSPTRRPPSMALPDPGGELWGIGAASAAKLSGLGVESVADLPTSTRGRCARR